MIRKEKRRELGSLETTFLDAVRLIYYISRDITIYR